MVKKLFSVNESGYHNSAKKILFEWLCSGGFNDLNYYTHWAGDGVYMEYPLINTEKKMGSKCAYGFNYHFGDERYDYYFNHSKKFKNDQWCPSFNQCVDFGEIPIAVLDLAIIYKGTVTIGFEIFYKNKVSNEKKLKLQENFEDITIYEINAHDILKQTHKPINILQYCTKIL